MRFLSSAQLPEILAAVSPQREKQLRRNLRKVWHRCVQPHQGLRGWAWAHATAALSDVRALPPVACHLRRFVYTAHPLLRGPIDRVVASNRMEWQASQQEEQQQKRRRLRHQDGEGGAGGGPTGGRRRRRRRRGRGADGAQQGGAPGAGDAEVRGWPFHRDDAFHTIIQWLHGRALQRDGNSV